MTTERVRLETYPRRLLAVVRRRVKPAELSTVVPDGCGLVWNFLRGRQISGAGRHVALYWDGEINLEVGVELDAPFVTDGEVVSSATPAGLVASTIHFGPYPRLQEAHATIRHWCKDRRHEIVGPRWEVYGHWEEEWNRDPAKIRTDVHYLVRPQG